MSLASTLLESLSNPDLKAIAKDIDLYGSEVMLIALRNKYKAVAYTKRSIPGPGSPCRSSKDISLALTIRKVIFHNNNEVTVYTNHGNLRYF
jgi:hypothetical protein